MSKWNIITRFYDKDAPIYVKQYYVLSTMLVSALTVVLLWDIIIGECLTKLTVIAIALVFLAATTVIFIRFMFTILKTKRIL